MNQNRISFVISHLEYWFNTKKRPFYKFTEPCRHRLYKEGDSWVEELMMTRISFNRIFDEIGMRYKTKKAFLQETDKFKGMMYACYHDRISKQTFYFRNDETVNEFLEKNRIANKVLIKNKLNFIPRKKPSTEISAESKKSSVPKTVYNEQKFRSNIDIYNNIIYLKQNTTLNSIVSKKEKNEESGQEYRKEFKKDRQTDRSNGFVPPEDEKTAEKLKEIWLEEIEDFGTATIRPSFSKTLVLAFKKFFGECWDKWRRYCKMIASSKFLMGEANNRTFKKIWITWAIKPEIIKRIISGDFGLGTREMKKNKELIKLTIEKEDLQIERKKVEASIEIIKEKVDKSRRKELNDQLDNMTEEQIESFRKPFINSLYSNEDSWSKDLLEQWHKYPDKFWDNIWARRKFDQFLRFHVSSILFKNSLEEEITQLLQRTNLLTSLNQIEKDIEKTSSRISTIEKQELRALKKAQKESKEAPESIESDYDDIELSAA